MGKQFRALRAKGALNGGVLNAHPSTTVLKNQDLILQNLPSVSKFFACQPISEVLSSRK